MKWLLAGMGADADAAHRREVLTELQHTFSGMTIT